jgi:protein-S-isoprenylcysteine O-methyltransferase Ste14
MRKAFILLAYFLVFWLLLPGFLFASGSWLDRTWPVTMPDTWFIVGLGTGLLILGGAIMASATAHLCLRGKGLPVSHLPPVEFVSGGLYRYFRHPIYVGYTAAYAGASLLIHSFWSLAAGTPLLVIGWIVYVLLYEEPVLLRRFGRRYETYRTSTPLLVSRRIFPGAGKDP